jgi:hypothetical protein
MASSFTRFLDHTQWRATVGRTPLDEWSARHRDLYLTTHNTHKTDEHPCLGGIQTHNCSRRAAVDLRLRPRGHWEQRLIHTTSYKFQICNIPNYAYLFITYWLMISAIQTTQIWTVRRSMKNYLERMGMKCSRDASFEAILQHLSGWTDRTHVWSNRQNSWIPGISSEFSEYRI